MYFINFRYIACVLAQHNFGLAAMSKSLRFKTRSWWYDEQDDEYLINHSPKHQNSIKMPSSQTKQNVASNFQASIYAKPFSTNMQVISPDHTKKQLIEKRRSTKELILFLAPPSLWHSSHKKSQIDTPSGKSAKLSITSFDYQIN